MTFAYISVRDPPIPIALILIISTNGSIDVASIFNVSGEFKIKKFPLKTFLKFELSR